MASYGIIWYLVESYAVTRNFCWALSGGTLKGMRENIFGLLWHIKQAVPAQSSFTRGPASAEAAGDFLEEGGGFESVRGGGRGGTGGNFMSPGMPGTPATPGEFVLSTSTAPGSAAAASVTIGSADKTTATFHPVPATAASKAAAPPGGDPKGFGRIERGKALSGYEAGGLLRTSTRSTLIR
jgi:hypothetical protein